MIRKIVTSDDFPDYHEGMLIMKMRETAGPTFTLAASRGNAAEAMGTLGMSALSAFERGGLIKRIVPAARRLKPDAKRSDILRMAYAYVNDEADPESVKKRLINLPEIESADIPPKRSLA